MMTNTHLHPVARNEGLVTIRALSSIRLPQAELISQAIEASGRPWTVQTIDDYDGYLSILIEPTISDDEQKAFFISGTAHRLELFETYNDNLTSVAAFNDAEALSARLLDCIAQQ